MKNKKLFIAFLKFLKKSVIPILLLSILLIIYLYVIAIDSIPSSIILFRGEELNLKQIIGLTIKEKEKNYESVLTSTTSIDEKNQGDIGTRKVQVKLFNIFNVKNIDVNIIERTKVIPVGQVAGLKLYTTGVLVVGMSEIKGIDNEKYKPYENSGIQEGDTIVKIENNEITDTDELIQTVNKSRGKKLKIEYVHQGEKLECSIKPVKTSETEYKLGLWIRDSAAGIGTMTYYEPKAKNFAALGHGITDIDTGEHINISNGEFITTKILSIIKGENGNPGKIQGSINNQKRIGTINKNSIFGIYGNIEDISKVGIYKTKEMEVAIRNEIELGEAEILCTLDGENAEKYKIQIDKIFLNNDYDNKSMFIRVTDDRLIKKTGGIIQGMSGSPVIQNGKFIGAVTNVLVNDPTKGYVVFGDIMIKEMKSLAKK